jgi:hypothetical protein
MTVWDGGGNDTYNFSNYSTSATINLAPGAWSTPSQAQRADLDAGAAVHLARGSIANAMYWTGDLRPLIENAIGGQGSDKITGNVLGNKLSGLNGNDVIAGLAGKDTLAGGLGRDTLAGGDARDIFDFDRTSDSKPGPNRDTHHRLQARYECHRRRHRPFRHRCQGWCRRRPSLQVHRHASLHYRDLGASCLVQGDVNGDAKADFEILVKIGSLAASDFFSDTRWLKSSKHGHARLEKGEVLECP